MFDWFKKIICYIRKHNYEYCFLGGEDIYFACTRCGCRPPADSVYIKMESVYNKYDQDISIDKKFDDFYKENYKVDE